MYYGSIWARKERKSETVSQWAKGKQRKTKGPKQGETETERESESDRERDGGREIHLEWCVALLSLGVITLACCCRENLVCRAFFFLFLTPLYVTPHHPHSHTPTHTHSSASQALKTHYALFILHYREEKNTLQKSIGMIHKLVSNHRPVPALGFQGRQHWAQIENNFIWNLGAIL